MVEKNNDITPVKGKKSKRTEAQEQEILDILNRIVKLAADSNMSQKELSEKLGNNPGLVATWKDKKLLPNAFQLREIAKLFNTSIDYLVTGVQDGDNNLQESYNTLITEYSNLYKDFKRFRDNYESTWRRIEKVAPIAVKEYPKKKPIEE